MLEGEGGRCLVADFGGPEVLDGSGVDVAGFARPFAAVGLKLFERSAL